MKKILSQKFFNQPTLKVAENLLGKFLVWKYRSKEIALIITEVEAYDGFDDKASHASHRKTERNKIMFEKAGKWYIYFTYGMHWMLNIVCGPKNYPAAILIRGGIIVGLNDKLCQKQNATLIRGKDIYNQRGRVDCIYSNKNKNQLNINGPARITKFLKIDKKFNGLPANKKTSLWIENRGIKIKKSQIIKTKRIGVEYAGKVWANKPYRFILKLSTGK